MEQEHDYSEEAKEAFMLLQVTRGRREDGSYVVSMQLKIFLFYVFMVLLILILLLDQ